jgi:hypothetical protein
VQIKSPQNNKKVSKRSSNSHQHLQNRQKNNKKNSIKKELQAYQSMIYFSIKLIMK